MRDRSLFPYICKMIISGLIVCLGVYFLAGSIFYVGIFIVAIGVWLFFRQIQMSVLVRMVRNEIKELARMKFVPTEEYVYIFLNNTQAAFVIGRKWVIINRRDIQYTEKVYVWEKNYLAAGHSHVTKLGVNIFMKDGTTYYVDMLKGAKPDNSDAFNDELLNCTYDAVNALNKGKLIPKSKSTAAR